MAPKGQREVRLLMKKKEMCCVGVSSQLEKVLSGPAPDACRVFARHKIGLKEISGSALEELVQPVVGCRV